MPCIGIETGVWRGGACIFMKGIIEAYGERERRVFVAENRGLGIDRHIDRQRRVRKIDRCRFAIERERERALDDPDAALIASL